MQCGDVVLRRFFSATPGRGHIIHLSAFICSHLLSSLCQVIWMTLRTVEKKKKKKKTVDGRDRFCFFRDRGPHHTDTGFTRRTDHHLPIYLQNTYLDPKLPI